MEIMLLTKEDICRIMCLDPSDVEDDELMPIVFGTESELD